MIIHLLFVCSCNVEGGHEPRNTTSLTEDSCPPIRSGISTKPLGEITFTWNQVAP